MMGLKARAVTARHTVSLEDLVPADDFYRHLDRVLDLAFVRDLVRDTYAPAGRRSIDPVVFFRLQLILFFEGLRSERQLLRVVADRLSLRWYLGYDLGERLPDHSSLTRIRDRYGLEVFRRFFEAIVEQCQAAGLVWGKELYIDGTKVEANAALHSLRPRFYVEAHLRHLFSNAAAGPANDEGAAPPAPVAPPTTLPTAPPEDLAEANARRHDWLAEGGRQDRQPTVGRVRRRSERRADLEASTTDPDATPMDPTGGGRLGYKTHYVVDGGKARIIVAALVTPAEVRDNQPAADLLWYARFRWGLRPRQVTGDTHYGTFELIAALEDAGIRAYVPLPDWNHRTGRYGASRFRYDPERDEYRCPQGHPLPRHHVSNRIEAWIYRADTAICAACPVRAACTTSRVGRTLVRSFYADYLDRVRAYQDTPAYQKALRKRAVWVEPLFGEAKDWHGLRRFRLRRLPKVNTQALLTAAGQNLKRLLRRQGWGRRPWPGGPAAAVLGCCSPPQGPPRRRCPRPGARPAPARGPWPQPCPLRRRAFQHPAAEIKSCEGCGELYARAG
ncbi:MAG TPA: IS1182 family transposase, partial [Chloroflexota bacterium]|nr:IS1182 family transposase [Chloroflexota bacterium]